MPAGYGIGDHCLFVLDFLTSSLIGHEPPKIVRAAARRLNTNIPQRQTLLHQQVGRVNHEAQNSGDSWKGVRELNIESIINEVR